MKKIIIGSIILIIVIISIIIFSSRTNSFETTIAEVSNIREKVSVTGKVTSFQKAEMGFDKSGIVGKIYHQVGDTVKAGDIILSLDTADAYAQLIAEKARLADLTKGLRSEELSVEDSKLTVAQTSLDDARTGIITALHDAYIKSESSLVNYADIFFTSPQSVSPILNIRTDSYNQKNAIENKRAEVTYKLQSWKSDLDSLGLSTTTDPAPYLEKVKVYAEYIKTFLSSLSTIVSALNPGNSGLNQSQIDAYNLSMNTALSTFTSGISTLASADTNYRSSLTNLALTKNEYTLKKAGSSAESIEAQSAKVDQARAELAKKSIIAPIDGVVTRVDPQLGEFVSAGAIIVTVMTDTFKIEVNIPETDIAKVSLGNNANITLDAYGDDIVFNAHVSAIDPAETVIEGVPTYKVTLQFDEKDARIRSGMTANIDIITQSKDSVVTVPFRAVLEKDGKKYVRVVRGDSYEEVPVEVGIRGNDGKIEIKSGVESGASIVTSVK